MELETINKLTMTSREIAELTGKQHHHVCRDIWNMLKSLNIDNSPFLERYKNHLNQNVKTYNLPKEETLILVSGYNVEMRARIIRRWLELEQKELLLQIPQSFSQALQLAADQAKQLEEQKPFVDFAETVQGSSDTITMSEYAKIMNCGPNKLRALLRDQKIFMDGSRKNQPYQNQLDLGRFKTTEKNNEALGEIHIITLITGKGQIWLGKKLIEWGFIKSSEGVE